MAVPVDLQLIFFILSLAGTAVFAISGALLALRKEIDVVGVGFIAVVTGVGGGTVRDLLLGATPVGWVKDPTDIAVCIGFAVLCCAFNRALVGRRMTWLLYADAAGLALFAVAGAAKADALGAHPLVSILLGAMSATFGGILRDIVCGETPVLFRRELYITPALLGAAIFVLMPASIASEPRALAGLAASLSLRLLAMARGWNLPFPDYRAR
jgi:uncharacterized membrane protein YeiH